LRYLSLRQDAGDIMQRADALCRTREQQKRCSYRNYLTAASSQAPHTEQNKRFEHILHGTTGGGVGRPFS
jgi:hypothetical protein